MTLAYLYTQGDSCKVTKMDGDDVPSRKSYQVKKVQVKFKFKKTRGHAWYPRTTCFQSQVGAEGRNDHCRKWQVHRIQSEREKGRLEGTEEEGSAEHNIMGNTFMLAIRGREGSLKVNSKNTISKEAL